MSADDENASGDDGDSLPPGAGQKPDNLSDGREFPYDEEPEQPPGIGDTDAEVTWAPDPS